jgi:hypothetical protein
MWVGNSVGQMVDETAVKMVLMLAAETVEMKAVQTAAK